MRAPLTRLLELTLWQVALCLILVQTSRGALLLYDGFDYTEGEELGEDVSRPPWENDKSQFTIVSGSLEYPGLQESTGCRVIVKPTQPKLDSVRTGTGAWAPQAEGTLYVSLLLRLQSTAGISTNKSGISLLTIGRSSNKSQLLGINLLNDGTVRLGILKYPSASSPVSSSVFFSSGTAANLSAGGSTTYLLVAKYEWVEGAANDAVTLWVNPTTLGSTEDPNNKVSTDSGPDGLRSAGRLTLSRGPNTTIDELRIGQTWADVTPTDHQVITQP